MPATRHLAPLRLAELLGAMSVATDMAAGQPTESALGASVVAVRLARNVGVASGELAPIYFATLLRFVGCSATAAEASALGAGQDAALNHTLTLSDWADPTQVERALRTYFAPHVPDEIRQATVQGIMTALPAVPSLASLHCLQAQILGRRAPVPPGTIELIAHMHARWDDRVGGPHGEAVPIGERIIAVAAVFEVMRRTAGLSTALDLLKLRAGTQLDPELCRCVERNAASLTTGLDDAARWERFLDAEPGAERPIAPHELAAVATSFADFADHKSPWLLGHSRQVAGLVFMAGNALGLSADEREELRIAALLHDLGRVGVANAIWDKPGTLSPVERVKAEAHTVFTEQILALSTSTGQLRHRATLAHERANGSGYHRKVASADAIGGLLAAADIYDALTHERPWRTAFAPSRAADMLLADAAEGRLHRESTRAVLDAAGHGKRTTERAYPAGLTQREVEVVRLIARGLSTKAIAERLGISAKTADHHIQRTYDKCGVRGRAAIAVFAIEHEIVDD